MDEAAIRKCGLLFYNKLITGALQNNNKYNQAGQEP
jgi:hypothetical protein